MGLVYLSPSSQRSNSISCANPVSIVQFNLSFENDNVDYFVDYLAKEKPNLVVMQEVAPKHGDLFYVLEGIYPYRYGGQSKVGYPSNQLILSQGPLYGLTVYRTPDGQNVIQGIWQPKPDVNIGLLAAHPPSPRNKALWYRRDALIRTIEYFSTRSTVNKNLIVGDFNLSANTPHFATLFPGFETLPVASWSASNHLPISLPWLVAAIDHLWFQDGSASSSAICSREAILDVSGSDHVPIKTILNIDS